MEAGPAPPDAAAASALQPPRPGKKRPRSSCAATVPRAELAHGFDVARNLAVALRRTPGGLRLLAPYLHVYPSHVKQRWRGRALLDVFTADFDSHDRPYFAAAIARGLLSVNGAAVGADYRLRDGDFVQHTLHRHEPPVAGDAIRLLGGCGAAAGAIVAALKPGGIPVHPCGPHQFLSLLALLAREHGLAVGDLHPVHRLDRLTSGIVLLARGRAAAQRVSAQFRGEHGGVRKRYVALLEGDFPRAPCDAGAGESAGADGLTRDAELRPLSPECEGGTGAGEGADEGAGALRFDASAGALAPRDFVCDRSEGALASPPAPGPGVRLRLPPLATVAAQAQLREGAQAHAQAPALRCAWIAAFRPQPVVAYVAEGGGAGEGGGGAGEEGGAGGDVGGRDRTVAAPPVMRERSYEQSAGLPSSSAPAPVLASSSPLMSSASLPPSADPPAVSWTPARHAPRSRCDRSGSGGDGAGAGACPSYLRVSVALRTTDPKNAMQAAGLAPASSAASASASSASSAGLLPQGAAAQAQAQTQGQGQSAGKGAGASAGQGDAAGVTAGGEGGDSAVVIGGGGDVFASVGADRASVTLFRRLCGHGGATLVEALPLSGRTHQIRLHAAWLGFPVVGDVVYSRAAYSALVRQAEGPDTGLECGEASGGGGVGGVGDADTFADADAGTDAGVARAAAARSLCVCCRGGFAAEFTAVQRKPDGVCLHSCEYEGGGGGGAGAGGESAADDWRFAAPLPAWADAFLRGARAGGD